MKKTKYKLKKMTSFFVALVMIITIFPLNILANFQALVSVLSLTDISVLGNTDYNIQVKWNRPLPSTVTDNAANAPYNTDIHDTYRYDIFWRNGTKKENYDGSNKVSIGATDSTSLSNTITANLEQGSLYSFYVDPNHDHEYTIIKNGVETIVMQKAPKEPGTVKEALYLSDINVAAQSAPNGFNLTWDNPTYMGSNVFDGYRMYYAPGGSTASLNNASYVDMFMTDSGITINSGNTISYDFEVPNLQIGKQYAVKIDPLYNGKPVKANSISSVIINGTTYSLAYTKREYRSNEAYVKPALYIMTDGLSNVKLYWDNLKTGLNNVTKVEVYQYPNADPQNQQLITTYTGSSASTINYCMADYPDVLTSYKIVITYQDDNGKTTTMESNLVYFDPTYEAFKPYQPVIVNAVVNSAFAISIDWKAFLRDPFNSNESATPGTNPPKFLDDKLNYKIWVTDNLNNLSDNRFEPYHEIYSPASAFTPKGFTDPETGNKILIYNTSVSKYFNFDDNIATELKISDNQIYYIKIQAYRDPTGEESVPEYYSIYVPPSGDVITNPITIGNPPLRIAKDETGADIITDSSIMVQWDTQWYEAFDNIDTKSWNAIIGVDPSGKIVFGDDAKALEDASKIINLFDPQYRNASLTTAENNIYAALIAFGAKDQATGTPYRLDDLSLLVPIRDMDLNSAKYEIFTAKYDFVEENGDYEEYLSTIIGEDTIWKEITPTGDPLHPTYDVTDEQAPDSGSLANNTAYVIYFRSYIIDKDGNKVYSYYPSFVIGNTLKPDKPIEITPSTQILEAVSASDTDITVRWPYSSSFTYDLKYSDNAQEYSSGGLNISDETIKKDGIVKDVDGVQYIYYKVPNLFPESMYYFWLKASSGTISSDWSAPVYLKTLELIAPPVPKGLGLISTDNLDIINKSNSSFYKQTDATYLILEWLRIGVDILPATSGIVNDSTGIGEEILFDSSILNSYAVKFNALQANKRYYARVKSRISVKKDGSGGITKSYSYIISFADNSQFLDAIEFEVPFIGAVSDGSSTLVKESEWCEYKSFLTGTTENEYDGNFDPELYPLPETDYDTTYDSATDTLTYEFRGDGNDSTGTPNNGVDNRFISDLIKKNIYDYSIDLTKYDGVNVSKRQIIIPFSVLNAMAGYKTSLTVKTGNMYTKIDLSAFKEIAKANNVKDFGVKSKVMFQINEMPRTYDNKILQGQSYASVPQKITGQIVTPTRSVEITTMPKPLNIGIAIDNRFLTVDNNVKAYTLDANNAAWKNTSSKYNTLTNKYNFTTGKMGSYSVIAKPTATATEPSPSNDATISVNSVINIEDMPYFTASKQISANQFNNIVAAVAKNKVSVKMDATLSSENYNSLGRGKMLVDGSYVTREKGISSLVRLYELKTKSSLSGGAPLSESGFSDYAKVSASYKTAVGKAVDIGMLDNDDIINPQGNMTFGEFMQMLEFVALDAQ